MKLLKPLCLSFLLVSALIGNTQYADALISESNIPDTLTAPKYNWKTQNEPTRLQFKKLVIPTALITYGALTLGKDENKGLNAELKDELWSEHPHKFNHADTYLQFAPAVSVYLLNAFGVKGQHNFRDRTMIYLMSNIFVNGIVYPTKKLTHRLRPDGSNYNSFPSGHTAEAFASAEFMRMEYKNVSPWYGVAGYTMAVATGYLRMYNNKHWFSDVVAGAGIGILSTKLSYWLYPKIQHSLFKDKHPNTVIMPTYQNKSFGVSMISKF